MQAEVGPRLRASRWIVVLVLLAAGCSSGAAPASRAHLPGLLPTDRHWDVLSAPLDAGGERKLLAQAAGLLGDWRLDIAGVGIDGPRLARWAASEATEPLPRVVREDTGRAIDLPDFLLFLDDVLRAGRRGLRGEVVWITPGRARSAGLFVHPDDVFVDGRPRLYGVRGVLPIDRPKPQRDLVPARDGDPPGSSWTARYPNPKDERSMLDALAARPRSADFARRIEALLDTLRRSGAEVSLNSTVRSPRRGYLMWGAYLLSRCESEADVEATIALLDERNVRWGRGVSIAWRHPDGWRGTRELAREMADTYQVVYATQAGARESDHYTGLAVDLVAVGLPRTLVLKAPDGEQRAFDLGAPGEPRDLSLTPELIAWVEAHFAMRKLSSDYPHWTDASRMQPGR